MKTIPTDLLPLPDAEIAKRLEVSKQYVVQLRRRMRGLCAYCNSPAEPGIRECAKHQKRRLKNQREAKGHKPWKPGNPGRPLTTKIVEKIVGAPITNGNTINVERGKTL